MRLNFNKSMVALKGENLHLKHIKMPLNTFSKSPKLLFFMIELCFKRNSPNQTLKNEFILVI